MASNPERPNYGPFPIELLSQGDGNFGTYTANCHCGKIKFRVKLSPPFPDHGVASCNCSVCRRNGYLLAYALREHVQILRGGESLAKYSFNRHNATHVFCPTCGSSAYIDFNNHEAKDVLGINIRLIDDVDLNSLNLKYVDGASHPKAYHVE